MRGTNDLQSEMEQDSRLQRCGFAKLVGQDFEYFIRKYEISLGRKSKSTELDVVLGDNTNVSRQHAIIRYNFTESTCIKRRRRIRATWMDLECFELVVQGKNGVHVEGILHTPDSPPIPLRSQYQIRMGDRVFFFLLPKQDPTTKEGPTSPIETDHQIEQEVLTKPSLE